MNCLLTGSISIELPVIIEEQRISVISNKNAALTIDFKKDF